LSKDQSLQSRILTIDASGILVLAGLACAAYFLGAAPVLDARAQIEEQRQLLEAQAHNAADVEGRVVQEQKKLVELKAKLEATDVPLFPAAEINKRLEKITRLTETHGLSVQQLDPGLAKLDPISGKFTLVPIRIVGAGSFSGVSKFLDELLATAYPDVEVRTMSLSAAADANPGATPTGQPDATFAIDLRWYAAPAANAVGEGNAGSAAVDTRK